MYIVEWDLRGRIHMSWHHTLGGFSIWRQASNIAGESRLFPVVIGLREMLPLMTFSLPVRRHFSPAFICLAASKPWTPLFHNCLAMVFRFMVRPRHLLL